MIIPIIMDSGSGPSDPLFYLAILILINLICFSIFIVRSLIWFIKKPKYNLGYPTVREGSSFWQFTIWNGDNFVPDFITYIWCFINGFALLVWGSWFVYHIMGGTLPFI